MGKKRGNIDDFSELDYLGYGMDKDDALDRFLPYRLIDIVRFKHMEIVVVLMGADDPSDLPSDDVLEFAKDKAEFELNARCIFLDGSDVIVNGQNELSLRLFTFRKYR